MDSKLLPLPLNPGPSAGTTQRAGSITLQTLEPRNQRAICGLGICSVSLRQKSGRCRKKIPVCHEEAWQDLGTGTQGQSPLEEVSSLLLEVSSRETRPSLGKNITNHRGDLGFHWEVWVNAPCRSPVPPGVASKVFPHLLLA